MNPMLNELFLLSAFFYILGLLTLRIIGWNRSIMIWISTYTMIVGVGVWLTEIKWLLLGGIVFMLIASYYTLWILFGQFNACMREIKESDAQEGGNNNANA
jgi:hypothetical protein